jgi:hypothetical protein
MAGSFRFCSICSPIHFDDRRLPLRLARWSGRRRRCGWVDW